MIKSYLISTLIRVTILICIMLYPILIYVAPFHDKQYGHLIIFISILLIGLIIAVVSLYFNIKNFIAPFNELNNALNNLKNGEFKKVYNYKNSFIKNIFDNYNESIEMILENKKKLNDTNIMLSEYKKAIESAAIVSKTDESGIITYVNDKFCEISKYSRDDLIGQNHNIVRHPDIPSEFFSNMRSTIKSKKVWQGEFKNLAKDGSIYWVFSSIIPIINDDGKTIEYISIRFDITNSKIDQEKLEEYKNNELNTKDHIINSLNQINKAKDDFINIASHELRTPMTVIKGYLSMILDEDYGPVTNEVKSCLNRAYNSVDNLLAMINNMLDIAKIEAGKLDFNNEYLDILELINEIFIEMNYLSEQKKQSIKIETNFSNSILFLDKFRIRQIIINLISNSIKYTPEGGIIKFNSYVEDGFLIIFVSDNGIGISKENIGKIFEKFGQIKDSYTRNINGSGLGLPIVKLIVEKMGGEITVDSQINFGSTFKIRIPLH